MQTQEGSQSPTSGLLLPPAHLSFSVFQYHKNRCNLRVSVASGDHTFLTRALEVFYDQFDELPVLVVDSEVRWLLWFQQFEAERRRTSPGGQRRHPIPVPGWPAPLTHPVEGDDIQF